VNDIVSTRPSLVVLLAATALTLVIVDRYGPAGPAVAAVRGAARTGLAPVESAGDAAFDPVGEVAAGMGRGGELARENVRLRRAVSRSRSEAARVERLTRENAELSGLLGLAAPAGGSAVAARVVSVPDGRTGGTLLLDRGRRDGVAPGMPVVAAGGLVGRVVEATRGRATVLPVGDPGFAVGVRVGPGNAVGVTQGLRLDMLDPDAEVHRDDLVVTSGLHHSRFPGGLPVGRVVGDGRGGGRLRLLADAARLDLVSVLIWQAPE
jgi:rod shape-determining protein MreC